MTNTPDESSYADHSRKSSMAHNTIETFADRNHHALNLVRALQCKICSKPFRQPVSLPCGELVCKQCLPEPTPRKNISYFGGLNRQNGIQCPFHKGDGTGHAVADCVVDITIAKVLDAIREAFMEAEVPRIPLTHARIEQTVPYPPGVAALENFRSTFHQAEMGDLEYNMGLEYDPIATNLHITPPESSLYSGLANVVRTELDCQICCCLLYEPVTTVCGHTFCRGCLNNVLDRFMWCPICRHTLYSSEPISVSAVNKRLSYIISCLLPGQLAKRSEMEVSDPSDQDTPGVPLFVCALTFPKLPLFLHIFEPRYRLMLRRVMENGTRTFGMVLPNKSDQSQGSSENFRAPFMQYGSLLYITDVQIFPDGRSLVETTGLSRFKVESWHELDGYIVGRVRRVADIPLAEEEALEIFDRTFERNMQSSDPDWSTLSTQDLFELGLQFVSMMKAKSAPWFSDRILRVYGEPPDDPAAFPFWLATLLPIEDAEKYQLLPATSVRERLKCVVKWIKALEKEPGTSRFSIASSCNLM